MYAVAVLDADARRRYWAGGEEWSDLPEEAARFVTRAHAQATINGVLARVFTTLSPTVHIVDLEEVA